MKKLNVMYNGWGKSIHYGTLAESNQAIYFEFTPQALESNIQLSPIQTPLSTGLLGDFPAYQDNLPGFIADSLPDGWGRLLVDRYLLKEQNIPTNQITPLQRLALVGDRAIGALSFVPAEQLPNGDKVPMDLTQLSNQIQHVVNDKDTDALLQLILVGGSPQGARPKALIRYNTQTNQISTSTAAEGEDWLVKFPSKQDHYEVCAIEHVYANLARQIGIAVPPTRYFKLNEKYSAFAIKRFDRTADRLKIPVLTVAGALDLDFRIPNFDYRDLLRLTRVITNNKQQVYTLFLRVIFNIIFNNRDDHTKNFSFIMNEKQQWQISPAYDLTFNEGPGGYHQMAVMGEAYAPTKQDLIKLINDSALNPKKCQQLIETVIETALTFKQQALNQGHIRKQTINNIDKKIRENIKLLNAS
ncbi:type II toxin-antitoxin system HipA family toxin [Orbaceae bacterium ac157xtp]